MPFLAPTLDNANPVFALVIAPRFYLHHVEVVDRNLVLSPANNYYFESSLWQSISRQLLL